jgi:hypothetical protein
MHFIVRVKGRAMLKGSGIRKCYYDLKVVPRQEQLDFGALFKSNLRINKLFVTI